MFYIYCVQQNGALRGINIHRICSGHLAWLGVELPTTITLQLELFLLMLLLLLLLSSQQQKTDVADERNFLHKLKPNLMETLKQLFH